MGAINKLIDIIEECIAVVGMSAMSIITIVAVFWRYALNDPIIWSEEAARYLMVWSTLLGISIATKQKAHLGIDIFVSFAPPKLQKILNIISWLLLVIMYVFLVVTSIIFIGNAMKTGNVSPTMRIPFYLIYFALPIGFGISAFRGVQVLFGIITGKSEKTEEVLL